MNRYEHTAAETAVSTDPSSEDARPTGGDAPVTPFEQTETPPSFSSLSDVPSAHKFSPAPIASLARFTLPSREQLLPALAFWGVILLGALLRFWNLGDRPLHHDESLHAYFSMQLMRNTLESWPSCFFGQNGGCYRYDPLLHGPFQFHIIAFVYQISQWLGAPENGINTTTVRIAAASLGTVIVALPYFLRHHLGTIGAWLACFLLAVSPSMVYFSRFAREDIYMACFTLLLVVSVVQYIRTRKALWLILAALAFALSYATKEATFLTVGVFGSFFGAILVWEVVSRLSEHSLSTQASPTTTEGVSFAVDPWHPSRLLPRLMAPLALLAYFVVLGVFAKLLLGWLSGLSKWINANPTNANSAQAFVDQLKSLTEVVVPLLGVPLAIIVITILIREQSDSDGEQQRRGLARWIDPKKQRLLDSIVTMPWTHWFFALILGWTVFLLLFTALFTNVANGIGDGIWQGIYYWITQQQAARGGQPWYYYLMLIPLYEQIGLIFGLVGIVRSLLHPTRLRLFLIFWFVGNFFIYSWAGEKMPWLMIHITMPMLLLAAIGLEPIILQFVTFFKRQLARLKKVEIYGTVPLPRRPRPAWIGLSSATLGALVALFCLVLTLQNMFQVTYVHPADAPHEMMIYVQTTNDIKTVMARLDTLDKKFYGGKHQLPIVVTTDALWPFAWYLRDYTNTCFDSDKTLCPRQNAPVIITGGDQLSTVAAQYSNTYRFKQYEMRGQWNQGYMPPPCIVTKTNACPDQPPYIGVGPLLWLSYGNNPPANTTFNFGLATQHIWQWWWQRQPFGGIDYGYAMGLFIRKDLGVQP